MSEESSAPTISLRERSLSAFGPEEKLSKWLFFSFLFHVGLFASLVILPWFPASRAPLYPIYTVDLVGGERIGGTRFGTELAPAAEANKKKDTPPVPQAQQEAKKESRDKPEKATNSKVQERVIPAQEKVVLKTKERTKESKAESKSESASLDSVRERLIQSAVDRAKSRSENGRRPSKGEEISSGPGERQGAASLGQGGVGGGVVKGMDFIIYQNRMFETIKGNWAWVGQRSNLKVVVHFSIKDNGDIVSLKIVQGSGDASYDESVLRAVKKSSPLPAPPESYRKDFADVEISFRPKDLGA